MTLKRAFDIVGASVALVVFAPVTLIVGLAAKRRLGSPVLFRQIRPGLDGVPFTMVKFRTMLDERDADGEPLPDEMRRHPFGMFLRRTSLDELPSLLNVLAGEMSFVGPRPLMMEYLPRYSAEEIRRHEAKPGITGLAQVRGRNDTTWDKRFADDLEYVERQSFLFDLRIICATVRVLFSDGADAVEAELPEFFGEASSASSPTANQVEKP